MEVPNTWASLRPSISIGLKQDGLKKLSALWSK